MSNRYLLILREGPVYALDNGVRHFVKTVGKRFVGEYWSFGEKSHDELIGEMRLRVVAAKIEGRLSGYLMYGLRVVLRGIVLRYILGKRLVVMSYDPFRNGMLAVMLKYLTGAKFVCEVNGVYGNPDNLIDIEDRDLREKKWRRMLAVGSFVLRQADKIKLLYADQLGGFKLGEAQRKISCFFDLVDVSRFKTLECRDEKYLLFVGFPFWRKGVDVLLRAWSDVHRDHSDWKLVLIGWGLEQEARRLELPLVGTDFLGAQPVEIVADYMARCRAFVLPSRSEGMGRVLIEAGACAKPRIVTNVEGMPVVVQDGVDGLVFRKDDAGDLAEKLAAVICNPELARKLGEAARVRVLTTMDESTYVSEVGRLLDESSFG